MEFRTTIKPLVNRGSISHDRAVMLLGSCFSDNIGARLQNALFNVDVNPFGTLYNPASITSALRDLINCRKFSQKDLFEYQGRFHSFSHHSSFSGVDADSVVNCINEKIVLSSAQLKTASTIIITFGTAYVFECVKTQQIVSNCHKLPADNFNRRRMSVDEIVELWKEIIKDLKIFNPDVEIIFTVSPIRHLADGAHGNQVSKSTLLLAIDRLCNEINGLCYFPAYEIMMDDLRDYRFYASDMTHPSDVAIDYIYQIFSKSFFSEDTIALSVECEKVTRRLKHRHMTDDIVVIEKFNQTTQQTLDRLLLAHPYLARAINQIKI